MTLAKILKDTSYRLTQFSADKIKFVEEKIVARESKNNFVPFLNCLDRKKEIRLTPEEVIRQLYKLVLTDDFGYPLSRMELEYAVTFGRDKKRD